MYADNQSQKLVDIFISRKINFFRKKSEGGKNLIPLFCTGKV